MATPWCPINPEIIEVDTVKVSCDGGGVLGHPFVYLHIGEDHYIVCPYCSCRFVLKEKHHVNLLSYQI